MANSNARDTSNDVDFSAQDLRDWMDRHKMSISDVAYMVGVTDQAVKYWLTSVRRIPEPVGRIFNFFDERHELIKHF